MAARKTLIVLDRDGVLNALIDNPAEPRPDSPMRPAEVVGVRLGAGRVARPDARGFRHRDRQQPARLGEGQDHARRAAGGARGGRRSRRQSAGGVILSSHICYHRAEDACTCRKPATGLLAEAFAQHPGYDREASWMVGDRAPDIIAGATFGLQTALLVGGRCRRHGARGADRAGSAPDVRGRDLRDFAASRAGARAPEGRHLVSRQTLRFFCRVWRRAGLWRSKCLK